MAGWTESRDLYKAASLPLLDHLESPTSQLLPSNLPQRLTPQLIPWFYLIESEDKIAWHHSTEAINASGIELDHVPIPDSSPDEKMELSAPSGDEALKILHTNYEPYLEEEEPRF